MRVLITGAGGTLGTALAPMLAGAGHEPVLLDARGSDAPYERFVGDVRSPEDVRAAVRGAEIVVHAAGVLGTYPVTPREFYEVNLSGTFNVWEAAAEAGVRGLVFSSTMSVYKPHDQPLLPDRFTVVDEDTPREPRDLYGYTKLAGEELCRLYGRMHGIPSVALRYGMFSPEPFFPYGVRLLYGGVDVRDVAAANLAAVVELGAGQLSWGVLNIESPVPFAEADGPALLADPLPVLDRYYPGAGDLLRDRGVRRLAPIREHYPIARAAEALAWRPERDFGRWLDELRSQPHERAPKSPPWP